MALAHDHVSFGQTFIGRRHLLATLQHLLEEACGGRGRLALIAGEAGIGKTRLVSELINTAREQGWAILDGYCFPEDRLCPYAPLLNLLRAHYWQRRGDLEPFATELSPLVPDLLPSPVADSAALLAPELEKRRTFTALAHLFMRRSAETPLLLIIEDIHWSDDVSLEFLLTLARQCVGQRIFVVLTYRDDEGQSLLLPWLAQLDRAHLGDEIHLTRLARDEVAAMLSAMFALASPVRADFLEALCGLTEGNPFFIEEVLKALVAAGEIFYHDGIWDRRPLAEIRIPRSIHDTVQRSLARVSEHARHILALAAVVGRGFDFALLQALSDLAEGDLIAALKELIAERLVVEESGERFAFRHALVREAIYSGLLVRERALLHSTIATTIERQGDQAVDQHLADLAYHFSEAGLWRQARVYGRRAGEHALRMDAPRTAIEQLTRALDAARHEGTVSEPELLLLRGQAYETIGEFEHALADSTEALRLAAEQHDEQREWRAQLALGLLWTSRDYQRAEEPLRRALALARSLDDPKALAHSLNRLGNWYLNVDVPSESVSYHHQALALFRTLDDRRGRAETLDLLAMATIMLGDSVRSFGYFQEAVDAFRELNDRQGMVTPMVMQCLVRDAYLVHDASGAGMPAEVAFVTRQGEEAIKLAQLSGWRAGESFACYELSMCFGARGAYCDALDLGNRALAIAEEIQHRQWIVGSHVALGRIFLDILAFPLAKLHLQTALDLARALRSSNWVQMVSAMLASLCVQQGECDAAAALLTTTFDLSQPPQSMNQRMGWSVRGELALARGQPAVALEHVSTLLATRPEGSADEDVILRLWLLHGEACAALGQWDPAERLFREAQAAAEAFGLQPLLWRIHRALAQVYQQQGRHEQEDAERAVARTIIETLATSLHNAQLRETFLSQAQALVPTPRTPSPRKATKHAFGGLTAREREVVIQLARGKPNREIAAALVVSERTVEYHVGNILGKLGLSSRSQAAVWAVEHGLAAQSPASS